MKNISFLTVVALLVFSASIAMAATGLTIDVTGPGGISVKEVQPGLITGEIWAMVTGNNENLDDETISTVTGGLRITGNGSFFPFDPATNYEAPFTAGASLPVDISTDGKTLGQENAPTASHALFFRSTIGSIPGNGPFKLGTFQANLQEGDSVQFLVPSLHAPLLLFQIDGAVKNGATGHGIIYSGTPLTAVPEPSTFALLGMGTLGLFAWLRRRSRKAG